HGRPRCKFCSTGHATPRRYLAGDGSDFNCTSCSDCAAAASSIASWCGMSASTTGSTTGPSTTGGSTGSTTGGTPASCALPQQTCGAGKKCVATFDGSTYEGTCVTDGTVAAGQPCTVNQSDPNTFNDNCRAGFVCDSLFGNGAAVCRKLCGSDGECAGGERCGDFAFAGGGWGWCAPTCTPYSSAAGNCAAGMDCGDTVDDAQMPSGETGFF